MTIINAKSLETFKGDPRPRMTLLEHGIAFNKAASVKFGLVAGSRINFINDGDFWGFVLCEDAEGFEVKHPKQRPGASIHSKPLIRSFRESYKLDDVPLPHTCSLQITKTTLGGNPVIEMKLIAKARVRNKPKLVL